MPADHIDAIEIDEFLAGRGTGVLSLAAEGDAYAIPVSFTYESGESSVYFRFGFGPESQKRRFIEATQRAAFVVYDDTADGWTSVVLRGPLETISRSTVDSFVTETLRNLDIPYYTVHAQPDHDVDFAIARLDAVEVSGIREGSST